MPTDRELADRAAVAYAESSRSTARLAGGDVHDEGGVLCATSRTRAPYFSWLHITGGDVTDAQLRAGIAWFDLRRQPFTVRVRRHQVERYGDALRDLGFTPELGMPGMVAPAATTSAARVDGLRVERVADRAAHDAFTELVAPGGPDTWLTTELYRELVPPRVIDDAATALLLGTLDGRPVANAAAFVHAGVVVVYAVGTAESVRRRGIGAAMTAAAIAWGRANGADLAFLTSSAMAESLYRSMGFRDVDHWQFWVRAGDEVPSQVASRGMTVLNAEARALIESGALAHLVTVDDDGAPHVAVVWVGVDGDELVCGHLDGRQRKLRNMRRDPRVAISFEGTGDNGIGMRDYLVVHGRARITEGGAPELLNRLAQTYVGPGTRFPPMPDPPPGFVTHIEVERVAGSGPWTR